MAYAALGAVQLLRVTPDDLSARRLLHDARLALPALSAATTWGWPYDRLTYANAVLPEAMIAVGRALHDADLRRDGFTLLGWLEEEQTLDGHLSVVPSAGRAPGDRRPLFDQQPIEVGTLAEGGSHRLRGHPRRAMGDAPARCEAWFEGENDRHLPLRDPATGGACDGLEDGSLNQNQGAESTLAWLATSQLARELAPVAAS